MKHYVIATKWSDKANAQVKYIAVGISGLYQR